MTWQQRVEGEMRTCVEDFDTVLLAVGRDAYTRRMGLEPSTAFHRPSTGLPPTFHRPSTSRYRSDGGTVIERFCPDRAQDGGAYEGVCRVRYTYLDDRGLLSATQGATREGISGRTIFDLYWACFGQGNERTCSVDSGEVRSPLSSPELA